MALKSSGRRCSLCGEPIQQNEKVMSKDGKIAHNHAEPGWREVRG